jgi:membrane fusion protein (multidrug efflux system)
MQRKNEKNLRSIKHKHSCMFIIALCLFTTRKSMRPFRTLPPTTTASRSATNFTHQRNLCWQNWRTAAATAVIGLPLLLSACGKAGDPTKPNGAGMPPPEVNVITVQPKNLGLSYEYVGQTAGSRETEVRARISGILEKRLYEEGSRVKAGTPLFQIDQGAYRTQLASAEAAAAVA